MKNCDNDVKASFEIYHWLGDNIYILNCSDLVCLKMQIKIIIVHHFIMK